MRGDWESGRRVRPMRQRLLSPILLLCALLASLLPPDVAAGRAREEPVAPGWSVPVPLALDDRPSLQSAPDVAIGGDRTVVGWVDSRNAATNLYAVAWAGDQPGTEMRVTHLSPRFDADNAFAPAFAVEPDGRAFAVYGDGEQIQLVRYDPAAGNWSHPVQVTQGLYDWHAVARAPQIATDGAGNLVVVWEDYRNDVPDDDWAGSRGSDIYGARCDGSTLTCADVNVKINSDETRGQQRNVRLSRRGTLVAVIWEDEREAGAEAPQIYAALSFDNGQTWNANQRVSAPAGSQDSATQPAIAIAPDGTIFAAWAQHSGGLTQPATIHAAQWTGAAWTSPQRVDGAPPRVRAMQPALAASEAGVFVAWQDHRAGNADIYAARWNGGGWSESPVAVQPGMQSQPALAASGGRVRLVWQDARAGNQDIFSASWQDGAWEEDGRVNTEADRSPAQMAPAIATFSGTSYAVYLDQRNGYADLWLSQLPLGTSAWSEPARLPTWANAGGSIPDEGAQIAVDQAGVVHAVWSEYLWPYGRYIAYAGLQGGRWSDPVRLSGDEDDGRERFAPQIAAHSGRVAVMWGERDSQGNVQLWATWQGSGTGWSAPVSILPAPLPERWELPATLALTGSRVVVAWGDRATAGRGRILAAQHSLQGGGWSQVQVSPLIDSNWCSQVYPALRSDGAGRLHIVWSGCALRNPPNEWPHDSLIFYAYSDDDGASFSTPLRVATTIAAEDDAHHNDTSSQPTLAVGDRDAVMVLYPARTEGQWTFYATQIESGAVTASQRLGTATESWAPPDDYDGRWYGGDSAGALSYDSVRQRFVAIFPDRRNQRTPVLYAATYAGVDVELRETLFLPAVRR